MPATGEKKIILFTSSTLHNAHLQTNVKTKLHIEIESICGATIPLLHANWELAYELDPSHQTIILVAGINDVIKNASPYQIMGAIKNWDINLKTHSKIHGHSKPNKLIVTGMLRPPKFAWFPNKQNRDINTRLNS